MPQSLAQVYVHIVFSTKERRPFLDDPSLREEMPKIPGDVDHWWEPGKFWLPPDWPPPRFICSHVFYAGIIQSATILQT